MRSGNREEITGETGKGRIEKLNRYGQKSDKEQKGKEEEKTSWEGTKERNKGKSGHKRRGRI